MTLKDYWQLAKISWSNSLVYRLNFLMWRVRVVMQLLTVYFLWLAVVGKGQGAFGYTSAQMLTYIMMSAVVRSLVLSARSIDVQVEIANGDLNNYLIKPINYFRYWLTRDAADKLLNLVLAGVEVSLLVMVLRPPIVWPTLAGMVAFMGVGGVAMMMNFYFNLLVSLTTFWWPEQTGWPQRFFVFTILEFLAGGLFPLDILPSPVFAAVKYLPTSYFLYVPLQVFLGRLWGRELVVSLVVMLGWWVVLKKLAEVVFGRGLRIYGAYGR